MVPFCPTVRMAGSAEPAGNEVPVIRRTSSPRVGPECVTDFPDGARSQYLEDSP